MIDYKTGGLEGQTAKAAARRYWTQLKAYAVGLHQSDADRRVELALHFTAMGESRTRCYEPEDVDELAAKMASQVRDL